MTGVDPVILGFLDASRDAVLFCRDRSGQPIGYPMRTLTCTASTLTFTTYAKSAKVQNLVADPRVSVLVVEESLDALRWVSVEGVARVVVPDEVEIRRVFEDPTGPGPGRSVEPRVPEGMGELVRERLRDGKRVLLDVGDLSVRAVHLGTGRPS